MVFQLANVLQNGQINFSDKRHIPRITPNRKLDWKLDGNKAGAILFPGVEYSDDAAVSG
jgi:hypothetical protein